MIDLVLDKASYIHDGVRCFCTEQMPGNEGPKETVKVADGVILLSSIVDSLGSIFHMYMEAVRFVQDAHTEEWREGSSPTSVAQSEVRFSIFSKSSTVKKCQERAVTCLERARDQLIREINGERKDNMVGPVLTPEAISIALMGRLVRGVYEWGTVDIISVYENCLEVLVSNDVTRRLIRIEGCRH